MKYLSYCNTSKSEKERRYIAERNEIMELHITCIPGDGIGPEIVTEAKKVKKSACKCGKKNCKCK